MPVPVGEDLGMVFARRDGKWERGGSWIADCVTRYCGSALLVTRGDVFDCGNCGRRYPIAWPTEAAQAEIEAILALRPDPRTRNWNPGETPVDLLMENLVHGVPVVSHPELGASASRLVLDLSGDTPRVRILDSALVIDSNPQLAIGA